MLLLPLAVVRLERPLHAWPPRTPGPRKWALGAARTADVEPSRTRTGGQARRPSVRLPDTARQSGPGPVEPNGRGERSGRMVRLGIAPSPVNFRRPRMWTTPARILVGVRCRTGNVRDPNVRSVPGVGDFPETPVSGHPPVTSDTDRGVGVAHHDRFSTLVDIPVDNRGSSVVTPAADDLWAKVAAAVRAQLSEATWNTWFQGVRALGPHRRHAGPRAFRARSPSNGSERATSV